MSGLPKILYVDDEKENLLVFQLSFKKHFDVRVAASGEEGLAILDTEDIGVVVSDQRMPGMAGADFLGEVRKRKPETMRMILTAYSDFADAVRAINEGQVARYINKPWKPEDMLATLKTAAETYDKIQDNRRLKEEIVRLERQAAVGKVTSGFVHELANLATVFSLVEDVREDLEDGEDISGSAKALESAVAKFSVITDSLRVYASGGNQLQIDPTPTDLTLLVADSLTLCRLFPQVRQLANLVGVPSITPLVPNIDGPKIGQILINLVKNAADACTPGQGIVLVTLKAKDGMACLSVEDNGPGISPEAASRIWEGFYSTKGEAGTGLGLVMSRKIARAHGGELDFENRPGGGCVFTLSLPLVAKDAS